MKKLIFVASFLMVLMLTTGAMALEIRTLNTWGPYQTGVGGEFTLVPQDGLEWVLNSYVPGTTSNFVQTGTFQSFCVEATGQEYIYKNTTYDVNISDRAVFGGTGQGGSGDPISVGTAWLYHQFQLGILGSYNYVDDPNTTQNERKISADALQRTIWWLEDEAGDPGDTNPFRYLVYHNPSITDPKADNDGQYPVAILNLWVPGHVGAWDYRRQDQLVCVPVPEPATMLLLGSGLLGLAGFARRRFRK